MSLELDLTTVRKAYDALRAGNDHAALEYLYRFLRDRPEYDEQEQLELARAKVRQSYHRRVENAADDIFYEFCRGGYDGNEDEFRAAIDSVAENHVTYTSEALECLMASNNDSAGIDELGIDGFDWRSGVPWSDLAHWAFQADVCEKLISQGLDLNTTPPRRGEIAFKCDDCGNVKTGVDGETVCNECNENLGNSQCRECHHWYAPEWLNEDSICERCHAPAQAKEREDSNGAGRAT